MAAEGLGMSRRETRILVVEDDETLRETLAEVLVDEGHEVRAAAHGDEALDHLDGWLPDLILLDLMMPIMDAYEFREQQLLLGVATSAPMVVISAARDIEAASRKLEAAAWISKPFLLAEVIDTVDRLLQDPA
jgi:CheY-like chemotaxis protein